MWRCPAAHDALRGGTCTAYSRRKMVVAEGMGHPSGPATRDASSDRRGRQASGCRSDRMWVDGSESQRSKDRPPFLRLPEAASENAGKTAVREINAFCFGRKMSS